MVANGHDIGTVYFGCGWQFLLKNDHHRFLFGFDVFVRAFGDVQYDTLGVDESSRLVVIQTIQEALGQDKAEDPVFSEMPKRFDDKQQEYVRSTVEIGVVCGIHVCLFHHEEGRISNNQIVLTLRVVTEIVFIEHGYPFVVAEPGSDCLENCAVVFDGVNSDARALVSIAHSPHKLTRPTRRLEDADITRYMWVNRIQYCVDGGWRRKVNTMLPFGWFGQCIGKIFGNLTILMCVHGYLLYGNISKLSAMIRFILLE